MGCHSERKIHRCQFWQICSEVYRCREVVDRDDDDEEDSSDEEALDSDDDDDDEEEVDSSV